MLWTSSSRGAPVDAHEAHAMGLANRVVPVGQALSVARKLAHQLAAFPQGCLQVDRDSAYRSFDLPLSEALRAEGAAGVSVVAAEGLAGAARFAAGAGRHGSFDGPHDTEAR